MNDSAHEFSQSFSHTDFGDLERASIGIILVLVVIIYAWVKVRNPPKKPPK